MTTSKKINFTMIIMMYDDYNIYLVGQYWLSTLFSIFLVFHGLENREVVLRVVICDVRKPAVK
jgi:hypothetical protein